MAPKTAGRSHPPDTSLWWCPCASPRRDPSPRLRRLSGWWPWPAGTRSARSCGGPSWSSADVILTCLGAGDASACACRLSSRELPAYSGATPHLAPRSRVTAAAQRHDRKVPETNGHRAARNGPFCECRPASAGVAPPGSVGWMVHPSPESAMGGPSIRAGRGPAAPAEVCRPAEARPPARRGLAARLRPSRPPGRGLRRPGACMDGPSITRTRNGWTIHARWPGFSRPGARPRSSPGRARGRRASANRSLTRSVRSWWCCTGRCGRSPWGRCLARSWPTPTGSCRSSRRRPGSGRAAGSRSGRRSSAGC